MKTLRIVIIAILLGSGAAMANDSGENHQDGGVQEAPSRRTRSGNVGQMTAKLTTDGPTAPGRALRRPNIAAFDENPLGLYAQDYAIGARSFVRRETI
jgi:hypothetical protein